jgi:hypothetical protein
MTEHVACRHVRDLLAEVAADAASGPDRALVAQHVADCDACRRELDQFSQAADELLLATPQLDPPFSFGRTVLHAMTDGGGRSPSRRWKRAWTLLAAASVLVVAALSAGGVWWVTASERRLAASYQHTLEVANGRSFAAAPLMLADGPERLRQVGHVFLYEGAPSWLLVVLEPSAGRGSYDVVVTVAGSRRQHAGLCVVAPAGCAVGDTVPGAVADVTRVQLVGTNGTVAQAHLAGNSSTPGTISPARPHNDYR